MRGSYINKRLGQKGNGQEISARGIKGQTERDWSLRAETNEGGQPGRATVSRVRWDALHHPVFTARDLPPPLTNACVRVCACVCESVRTLYIVCALQGNAAKVWIRIQIKTEKMGY